MAFALSDELLRETVEVYEASGRNAAEAARRTGMPATTIKSRLQDAARRGLLGTAPVLPGFRLSSVSTVRDANGEMLREYVRQKDDTEGGPQPLLPGHVVKERSTLSRGDGSVVLQWDKTGQGKFSPEEFADRIKAALEGHVRPGPLTPPPASSDADLLTLYPCGDWHLGLHAWRQEAETDWDLKIAERVIGRAMQDVISRSPSSATAVILLGGDTLHADNSNNLTPRSGNVLDVDGRYQKVIGSTCRLLVNVIEWALRRHEHVIVRVLRGNHDDHACVAVQYHLAGWFRSEPRVTVDLDPSLFWWRRFGKVLLGATHGHEATARDMPGLMAMRRPEDWGASQFRYVHTFHLHRSELRIATHNGVPCEVHETPIPKDGWAYGRGFQSGRSVQSITYHQETGYRGRCVETVSDGTVDKP